MYTTMYWLKSSLELFMPLDTARQSVSEHRNLCRWWAKAVSTIVLLGDLYQVTDCTSAYAMALKDRFFSVMNLGHSGDDCNAQMNQV